MKSKRKQQLEKELKEIKAQEKKKRKKWHKYEDPHCFECGGDGYIFKHYGGDGGYHNKIRCACSMEKTARYKKFEKDITISVKDYNAKMDKFIDNNARCDSEFVDTNRSW